MNTPRINIIAAIGKNRELGKDNTLLWDIPEDMMRFRKLTTGRTVIMGQKTHESIGRPLPNRNNIVLTQDISFEAPGCVVCYSLDEAMRKAQEIEKEEVFVIGGGSVYVQALPLAQRLYLTLVEGEFEADVFFPEYKGQFQKTIHQECKSDMNYRYEFVTLEK
jgi:dihydrofolate reductase